MKYTVDYNIYGSMEIEANSINDAMEKVGSMEDTDILKDSLTWGMNISPEDVVENIIDINPKEV